MDKIVLAETVFEPEVTCPHCKQQLSDSCELMDDEGIEYCDECDKDFRYTRDIMITYSSKEL